MTNLIGLILGFAIQAPAPASVPVLSFCDATAAVIAQAPREVAMKVHFAIAGSPTCYLATMTIDGREVRGYVLDRRLDAVIAFERSRVATEQAAFKAPQYIAPPDPPAAAPAVAVAKAPEEKKQAKKAPPKVAF
jgi:hypothetical protein